MIPKEDNRCSNLVQISHCASLVCGKRGLPHGGLEPRACTTPRGRSGRLRSGANSAIMRSNSPPRSAENIRPFHALPSRRLGSSTHSLRAERRDAATVVRSTMSQPNRAHEKKRGPKPKSYHDPASAATPLAAAAHRRRHHPAARRLQHSCITRFWSNNSLQFSALHTVRAPRRPTLRSSDDTGRTERPMQPLRACSVHHHDPAGRANAPHDHFCSSVLTCWSPASFAAESLGGRNVW